MFILSDKANDTSSTSVNSNVDIEVKHKGKGGSLAAEVVTIVDLEAQSIIENALKATCEQYDIAFLGEESSDDGSRFEKDYFWLVDPIDGTLSFCEKKEGYSVSIALVRADGTPVIGVAYDPLNDKLYHATKGQGAFINHQKIQSVKSRENTLNCYFDRSYTNDPLYQPAIELISQYAAKTNSTEVKVVAVGGAVLNACWVLENAPAVYFKFPKDKGGSIWDYAASTCMFNELGLPATDITGEPFELNRKESTYMNHKGLLFASDKALADVTQDIIERLR